MSASKLPAYEHVKAFVKSKINLGAWRAGDPVPSESVLQQQFGVSRMTVSRALRELVVEGVVTRVRGSGTVVAQLHRILSTLAFRDIEEEVLEREHAHATQVIVLESICANAALGQILKLPTGAKVFHSVFMHYEDAVPIQFEDRHVNPQSAPHYLDNDFETTTPTQYLLEHAPLTETSYSIEACLPSPREARCLRIKRSEPCLVMTRRIVSGLHVASLMRLVYPGMRYSFRGKFQL